MTRSDFTPQPEAPSESPTVNGSAKPIGTLQLTGIILKLKTRMYTRGSRGARGALAVLGGLVLYAVVGLIIWGLREIDRDQIATVLAVLLTTLAVVWTLGSMLFGGERVLSLQPFTLLPVPTERVLVAFLTSAFIGFFTSAAAIFSLSLVLHAPTLLSAVLIEMAAILYWINLVLMGRLAVGAMNFIQRKRRGRDVVVIASAVIALILGGAVQGLSALVTITTFDLLTSIRAIIRWTPWGWSANAIALFAEERVLFGLLWLIPAVALLPVLLLSWKNLTEKMLVAKVEEVGNRSSSTFVPRVLKNSKQPVLTASFARAFHQVKRDPRELIQVASFLPVLFLIVFPAANELKTRADWLVLSTIGWGAAFGLMAANLFGADGKNSVVDMIYHTDFRALLIGKAAAKLVFFAPVALLLSTGLAIYTGGWQFYITSLLLSASLAIAAIGLGVIVSVLFPYPYPEGLGFSSNNMANTLVPGLILMGLCIAVPLLLAPLLVPAILVSLFWSPLAGTALAIATFLFASLIFKLGVGYASRWMGRNRPKMLAKLARPT